MAATLFFTRPFLISALIAIASVPLARADRLIGLKIGEAFDLDRQTGEVSGFVSIDPRVIELRSQPIAQAYHPGDGLHYFVTSDVPESQLITFDSNTGLTSGACAIDPLADASVSIDFGAEADGYPLYSIGGGGNSDPGAIFVVDIATGDATATGWATTGVGGQAIAFNIDDGFLYHFYNSSDGGGGTPGLEKINIETGEVIPVVLSGDVHGVCNGVAYLDGLFYVAQKATKQLYTVTPAGEVSLIGTMPDGVKSLATDGSSLFAIGPDSSLKEIDITTAAYSGSVAVTNGEPVTQRTVEAVVRDPVTGILYMVAARNYPGDPARDALYQLDPLSGGVTNQVDLSVDRLTGFAFLPDGTLHAVSGIGSATPPGPNDLPRGTMVTINLSDGAVTAMAWDTTISSQSFEPIALAYNTSNGLLYRAYKDTVSSERVMTLETIDPTTGITAPAGTISVDTIGSTVPQDMVYDANADLFYLVVQSNGVYAVTPLGASTLILAEPPSARTYALEIEPDLKITGFSADGSSACVSFESVPDREYGLYSSTDLVDFEPVPGFETIQADAPENTEKGVPFPSADMGFYRLGPPVGD